MSQNDKSHSPFLMNKKSILDLNISPFAQLVIVLVVMIVMIGVTSIIPQSKYSSTAETMPWVSVCVAMLFFALINSILGFGTSNANKYYFLSLMSYAILILLGSILAWYMTAIPIKEAKGIKSVFIVITFGYLVFLAIVNLIRFFIAWSKRKDEEMLGSKRPSQF